MNRIEFTQYLRPDGKRKQVWINDMPMDIVDKANELKQNGCRFDIEVLTTGQIHMSIEDPKTIDENGPLAAEVVENGPEVVSAVEKLVANALEKWRLQ